MCNILLTSFSYFSFQIMSVSNLKLNLFFNTFHFSHSHLHVLLYFLEHMKYIYNSYFNILVSKLYYLSHLWVFIYCLIFFSCLWVAFFALFCMLGNIWLNTIVIHFTLLDTGCFCIHLSIVGLCGLESVWSFCGLLLSFVKQI